MDLTERLAKAEGILSKAENDYARDFDAPQHGISNWFLGLFGKAPYEYLPGVEGEFRILGHNYTYIIEDQGPKLLHTARYPSENGSIDFDVEKILLDGGSKRYDAENDRNANGIEEYIPSDEDLVDIPDSVWDSHFVKHGLKLIPMINRALGNYDENTSLHLWEKEELEGMLKATLAYVIAKKEGMDALKKHVQGIMDGEITSYPLTLNQS